MPGRSGADRERRAAGAAEPAPDGDRDEVELRTTADGERVHVDRASGTRGSRGEFYPAYLDPDHRRRYGWFCSNCGSTETAMDPMGRIACNQCENRRKPTRWDAAYL